MRSMPCRSLPLPFPIFLYIDIEILQKCCWPARLLKVREFDGWATASETVASFHDRCEAVIGVTGFALRKQQLLTA
jgi:hypothetical protein